MIIITLFPRIIAGGIISLFAQKGGNFSREGDFLREAIISNIAPWKSFVLLNYAIKLKNNHIELTEHGLFKCSKLSSLINFHSLNHH